MKILKINFFRTSTNDGPKRGERSQERENKPNEKRILKGKNNTNCKY